MVESSSAVEQVFAIPELRELILLQLGDLDPRTLLLSQRTSRSFAASIQYSPHLQRSLWFQPQLPHKLPKLLNGVIEINPLLEDCRSLKRGATPFGAGVRAKAATIWDEPTTYAICPLDKLFAESKGESWRNMILARMSGQKFRTWLWCYESMNWDDVELECDGQIRAGELVDKATELLRNKKDAKTPILDKMFLKCDTLPLIVA